MSENDDEEIRLRDKIAIAAMQALLTREGAWGDYINDKETFNLKSKHPRLQRIATAAYVIADEMRKARLKSFT
jgi:hypothetical protein